MTITSHTRFQMRRIPVIAMIGAAVILGLTGPRSLSASPAAPAQIAMQPPPGTADKVATVFGEKIHYLEAGSGPAVILLHGLGGDASNWYGNIAALSPKYHVIVVDQIGFGKSDKPLINYRVQTLVDFLDGFMRELKIDRASLVGNSLGGWTAAAFAIEHPEKVDRLVLVDAAGYSSNPPPDKRIIEGLNPSTLEGIKQVMSVVFYNKEMFSNPAVIDLLFTRKMLAGDGYTIQRFIDSVLQGQDLLDNTASKIKQPTLIIWGKQDALVPLAVGQHFNRDIAGSEMLVIDQCGHVPMIEKGAEFNWALSKFLAGQPVDGATAAK
ncbi:MAG TPA: alpha/beta fold hydrolase [Blastocatellia bacterium]